ncbi:hypothetical protein IEQ34_002900 [Dendrobium chrysotoxum]|uniref:Uncharacterized protein n=1 Tax=Dendrobium chrysotoxum TaxID=161865 RepID=A0AAV7HJ76_DENCH|nr:hypothetical protein IEQ34_002900 [Dendrobium chrysotoxum]
MHYEGIYFSRSKPPFFMRGDQTEEHLFSIAALTRGKILKFKKSEKEEEDPSDPRSSGGAGSSSSRKSAKTPKSLSDQVADLSGKMKKVTQFYEESRD